jgi:hypothetical protein
MLSRVKDCFREIEEMTNSVSDLDREWWPFGFLRPARCMRMSSLRVAFIAALYGVFVGMLANVMVAVSIGVGDRSPLTMPLYTTVGFFIVYRLTFAYFWNRRAERLASLGRS